MSSDQHEIYFTGRRRDKSSIRGDVIALHSMWKRGKLGGEKMPEDVHPELAHDSRELLHFLTLGMCLNYQRNSYTLWESCAASFHDNETRWIFEPEEVASAQVDVLRKSLLKHKVALQPNKHVENWRRVSGGIVKFGSGDMRKILASSNFDIGSIREFIQSNKVDFPYLAGIKICNYWLYVLLQYTSFPLSRREALNIAPDTHVVNASLRLGVISEQEHSTPDAPRKCADAWSELLSGTDLLPIDMHTALWLWSRLRFPTIEK